MRASADKQRTLQYDAKYAANKQAYDNMSDDDKAALVTKASNDLSLPGNGNWVPGTGKTKGYMNYLPPSGDPIKLSSNEAGEVFNLSDLMKIDPARARAELDQVSDKVRTLAQHVFDNTAKGVTSNNTATHDAAQDRSSAVSAGAAATTAAAHSQYYGALTDKMGEETKMRTEASAAIRPLVDQYNQLSPEDQVGPKGQAIQRNASLAAANSAKDVNGLLAALRPRGGAGPVAKPPIEWTKDGTVAVNRETKEPVFHMGDNGVQLPLGMSQQVYDKKLADATDRGVRVATDFDGSGVFRMGFIGPDGQAYDNATEAAASKPAAAGLRAPGQPAMPAAQQPTSVSQPPPVPAGGYPRPQSGLGPTPVPQSRGNMGTGQYSWLGKKYPDEQSALAAFYSTGRRN